MSELSDSFGVDEHTSSDFTDEVVCYATSDSFNSQAISVYRPLSSWLLSLSDNLDKLLEIVFVRGEDCNSQEHYKCSTKVKFYRHMVMNELMNCSVKESCGRYRMREGHSQKGRNLPDVRDKGRSEGSDQRYSSAKSTINRYSSIFIYVNI